MPVATLLEGRGDVHLLPPGEKGTVPSLDARGLPEASARSVRSQLKAVNRSRRRPATGIVLPIVFHLGRFAPEMAVGGRFAVHRVNQVEHVDDAIGPQVEVRRDELFETRVGMRPVPK